MLTVTEFALKKLSEFKGDSNQPIRLERAISGC